MSIFKNTTICNNCCFDPKSCICFISSEGQEKEFCIECMKDIFKKTFLMDSCDLCNDTVRCAQVELHNKTISICMKCIEDEIDD